MFEKLLYAIKCSIANHLPMTFIEDADFDDLVAEKPIKIYRDWAGRIMMATSATSDDRVQCPPDDLHINFVINAAQRDLDILREEKPGDL